MQISPATYRRITAFALASLVFITVTGAAVRLTGSGLGCSTWPSCEPDSFTPRSASDSAAMVEFGNRVVTGLVGIFTAAAVIGAHRRSPRRQDLFRWSLGLPVWVMGNAVVGAMVVWLHLSPISVIGHFLLSLGALWNAVVLHHKASEDSAEATSERRPATTHRLRQACNGLMATAALALISGTIVTGSGPHAGDEEADRLPFMVGEVARIHGISVILFLALALAVLRMASNGDGSSLLVQRLRMLILAIGLQGAVGYTQYFSGVPAWLVGIHVFGATVVWVAVLRVQLALTEPAPAVTSQRSAVATAT